MMNGNVTIPAGYRIMRGTFRMFVGPACVMDNERGQLIGDVTRTPATLDYATGRYAFEPTNEDTMSREMQPFPIRAEYIVERIP
jgi:hypothetical protein